MIIKRTPDFKCFLLEKLQIQAKPKNSKKSKKAGLTVEI